MDESKFHAARRAVVTATCVFEKALLAQCADCELAQRHALAEREAIACSSPVARTNCETLHALLRERCAFALKLPPPGERLPHAATMRLACGGLLGVGECVDSPTANVHRLVQAAQERHGSLVDLPWPAIVATVRGWQGRRPRGAGRAP
jgi:hypothetical protein